MLRLRFVPARESRKVRIILGGQRFFLIEMLMWKGKRFGFRRGPPPGQPYIPLPPLGICAYLIGSIVIKDTVCGRISFFEEIIHDR